MDDDERNRLLWPPWALNGWEGTRYDALDDEGKKVWRQTRGQRTDDDSQSRWAHELADAVRAGFISDADARAAIGRVAQ